MSIASSDAPDASAVPAPSLAGAPAEATVDSPAAASSKAPAKVGQGTGFSCGSCTKMPEGKHPSGEPEGKHPSGEPEGHGPSGGEGQTSKYSSTSVLNSHPCSPGQVSKPMTICSIDWHAQPMVAIKTTPGEPEERSVLTPGPHKMAICVWKDGTHWESDVPSLTLQSRNGAVKVPPGTRRKKGAMKVMKKTKATKAMKKPAAAAEGTGSSDGDEGGEEEDGSSDEEEGESEDEEKDGASEKGAGWKSVRHTSLSYTQPSLRGGACPSPSHSPSQPAAAGPPSQKRTLNPKRG